MNCRGVALITVLLVVFLATTVAATLMQTQQLAIRRSTLVLQNEQAQLYALGAESWASAILSRDAEDSEIDDFGESWAQTPPALPVDGGFIAGELSDLQGRFNLNNLLLSDGRVDDAWLEVFRRLLTRLDIEPSVAEAVADWIDADTDAIGAAGAEDASYLSGDPPYLAANRAMVDISELRLIRGMDAEHFDRLAPYVTALPERTTLNVNTAPVAVLLALTDNETLTEEALSLRLEDRERRGYEDVQAFIEASGLEELVALTDNLGVASNYFELRATAEVGDARTRLVSTLSRNTGGGVRTLNRAYAADH